MGKLLSVPEVADRLHVKQSWVRAAIFEKRLAYIKVGRLVRVEEEALNAFLEANRQEAATG